MPFPRFFLLEPQWSCRSQTARPPAWGPSPVLRPCPGSPSPSVPQGLRDPLLFSSRVSPSVITGVSSCQMIRSVRTGTILFIIFPHCLELGMRRDAGGDLIGNKNVPSLRLNVYCVFFGYYNFHFFF